MLHNLKHKFLFLFLFNVFGFCFAQQVSYQKIKDHTEKERSLYATQYVKNKNNPAAQEKILIQATNFLLKDIDQYFNAWYGTKWSFHGHTSNPKIGEIACGYFVTTVLKDMGFNVPRVKWAQLASESMIKHMTSDIKRFSHAPMNDVVKYLKVKGEGVYIVGLDNHVGYIYYYHNKMTFVHSNYYQPHIGVMSEPLMGKNPLNDSKYRVIGKILDRNMVLKWIKKEPFN